MRKETLGEQLAREAREYLADLRQLREDLRSAEGMIAVVLLVVAGLIAVAWVLVSIGFNPPNEHVTSTMNRLGLRTCRPIDNFGGVVVIIDMFVVIFLTVISFGNIVRMSARVQRGLPREPRDLIISSLLMIIAGVGGIAYMIWTC